MKWTTKMPTKPGRYWFYGESSFGSMGCHYRESAKAEFEPRLLLADVRKISNGIMITGDGQIWGSKPFDKKKCRAGPLGVWAKADLPDVPDDMVDEVVNKELGEQ